MRGTNTFPVVALIDGDRVQSSPLADNDGELVDVRSSMSTRLIVAERLEEAGPNRFLLRARVLERLVPATLPEEMILGVVEGYRSASYQARVSDGHLAALQADDPGWAETRARQVAT